MAVIDSKITKSDIFKTFIFSNFQQASFNFETIHGLAFCVDMIPTIKRIYPNKEDQIAALNRHLAFFNTHPCFCGPVIGVTMALEEEKSKGSAIDEGMISSVKVGLMGPLAGVGDSLFWGTIRPMLAAVGASIALSGSILGPLFFFLVFNAIRLPLRWYGLTYGFRKGSDIVKDLSGNFLKKLTEGATIMGLFIMGVLVTKWTTISIPLVISKVKDADGKINTTTVQSVLDNLIPGLLGLGLTLLMMKLLKKKLSPLLLITGLFVLGIIGYWTGILA
ncbi:mannose/fructose/sorbose PTS transporter subunit IID [Listeria booriae]|uniref:PTS mannose transporter subunit IID n=1 Tax=Listeria booriae TaxID=1552123 RepID=A0A7X1CHQ7_9LIST|nr:mannose/fructose/sorbose PTS transporter subunit IID [Listeria booriae]MBC1778060.1 PTS mannose transporter subunit IID [Listeria booriae]MBC1795423.1 PTS mannose transporter subunit IID [Listeria booriae]MBC1799056.1 PTS mannose transporter subunit IID [Listeria booriae]MBC1802199.1 PTS mannose transporter subunit IID [Listeria booriae]MBC1905123.1 PTS mannose transporter subunit IID [Listeria booriae]